MQEALQIRFRVLEQFGETYDTLLEPARTLLQFSRMLEPEGAKPALEEAQKLIERCRERFGLRPGDASLPEIVQKLLADLGES
ncbi:MAG: hypothetical protein FJX72_10360 [Armatimonadetes bacterium]|nr:hypothetical protein [Armatimonadota bacterium]